MKGTIDLGIRYISNGVVIKDVNRRTIALCILMSIVYVLIGVYPCQSMVDFAMALAWIIYLIPLIMSWSGLFSNWKLSEEMTAMQYKKGPVRLNNSGMLALLISGAQVFCVCYFMFTQEYESLSQELGLLVRTLALFGISVTYAVFERKYANSFQKVQ